VPEEKEVTMELSPRDLVHLAVRLNNGIDTIITTDRCLPWHGRRAKPLKSRKHKVV